MAKKKAKITSSKQTPSIFSTHKHLRWLLPVLVLVCGGIILNCKMTNQGIYENPTRDSIQSMSGWKTYTNDMYQFTIKYPQNFQTTEKDTVNGINLYSNTTKFNGDRDITDGISVHIFVFSNDSTQLAAELNAPNQTTPNSSGTYVSSDKLLIPHGFTLPKGMTTNSYRVINGSKTIEANVNIFSEDKQSAIQISCTNPGHEGACQKLLPQILSTIKFTSQHITF